MSPLPGLEAHPAACAAAATLFGLLAGSFLNVVITRLPRMLEREWRREHADQSGDVEAASYYADQRFGLAFPRSHCPRCARPLRPRENLPLLSWLWLRGRCRACGWRIPPRYPLVETLGAAASAAVVWRFGCGMEAASALLLTLALIALAGIDRETGLLPDEITLPFLWLGLALNLVDTHAALHAAVLGAIAGYGVPWLAYHAHRLLTGREGMGHGDFKLLAMLGAWLGWEALPLVIVLSSVAAIAFGVTMIVLRRHERSAPLPFGPFLAAAGWTCLLWGEGPMPG